MPVVCKALGLELPSDLVMSVFAVKELFPVFKWLAFCAIFKLVVVLDDVDYLCHAVVFYLANVGAFALDAFETADVVITVFGHVLVAAGRDNVTCVPVDGVVEGVADRDVTTFNVR